MWSGHCTEKASHYPGNALICATDKNIFHCSWSVGHDPLVHITGRKSVLFRVRAGLHQRCPFLFVTFMGRISVRSQLAKGNLMWWPHGLHLQLLQIQSHQCHQAGIFSSERFKSECEAAEIKISTSKCENMIENSVEFYTSGFKVRSWLEWKSSSIL